VVAERAFVRVNITFDDAFGVGRHLHGVGLAFEEFDSFLAEVTGEKDWSPLVSRRMPTFPDHHS